MIELKIFSDTPPSDTFKKVLHKSGSPQALCEACGRIHFNREQFISLTPDEIQEIKDDMEARPHLFVEHDTVVGISYVDIDDTRYVVDCECNKLREIEESWWRNREAICEYITDRASKNKAKAMKDIATAFKAIDAITPGD